MITAGYWYASLPVCFTSGMDHFRPFQRDDYADLTDNNWYIFIKISQNVLQFSCVWPMCHRIQSKQVRVSIKVTCLYLLDQCWISCNINGTRYFTGNRIVAAIFSWLCSLTSSTPSTWLVIFVRKKCLFLWDFFTDMGLEWCPGGAFLTKIDA